MSDDSPRDVDAPVIDLSARIQQKMQEEAKKAFNAGEGVSFVNLEAEDIIVGYSDPNASIALLIDRRTRTGFSMQRDALVSLIRLLDVLLRSPSAPWNRNKPDGFENQASDSARPEIVELFSDLLAHAQSGRIQSAAVAVGGREFTPLDLFSSFSGDLKEAAIIRSQLGALSTHLDQTHLAMRITRKG